jgi:hypothetical protein
VSVFKPVQFFGNVATLMEVDIPTGRTHQIRVHADYAGHPLLGDDKYGDRERNAGLKGLGLKRLFLHAQSIAFDWPGSGVPFHASAPLPEDLATVLDALASKKQRPRGTSAGAGRSGHERGGRAGGPAREDTAREGRPRGSRSRPRAAPRRDG